MTMKTSCTFIPISRATNVGCPSNGIFAAAIEVWFCGAATTASTSPSTQKIVMLFTSNGFIVLLVIPALDRRFGWSTVPLGFVVAGDVLVATGCYVIFLVFKENTFSSATIGVAENQRVISTGPYAVVRHLMYAGGLLYLLGIPLALGSWWAL